MLELGTIAQLVGGELLQGSPNITISGVASLQEATSEELSFFSDQRYREDLLKTKAGALLIDPKTDHSELSVPCIVVKNPSAALDQVIQKLYPTNHPIAAGIHPTAVIHPTATLGKNVSLGAYVVLERGVLIGANTQIGAHSYVGEETKIGGNSLIHSHVTIREQSEIGNNVILHPGVVIGSCGFGYASENGKQLKIPQVGIVVIEDDVEIGANTTIDRARFGKTVIGHGTKIDNLVQIAHNVKIGPHNIICSQVGISGSTTTGSHVTLAGQVGLSGHIEIEDKVIIGAQSGLSKGVETGQVVIGSPAKPIKEWKKNLFYLHNLGKLFSRVKALEKLLEKAPEKSPETTIS